MVFWGAEAETASFYIISVFDDEVDAFWPWRYSIELITFHKFFI